MTQTVLIVAGIVFICGAIPLGSGLFRRRRLHRLAVGRDPQAAREAFIRRLSDFERTNVEVIYQRLQGWVAKSFPILPDDRLMEDLDIDAGTLESFFEDEEIQPIAETPIQTCADLARAWLRKY